MDITSDVFIEAPGVESGETHMGITSLWNLLASTPALFNIFNGSTRDVLENRELLMEVNFIDECCHIYDEGEHIHHYTH